jgi:IS1 family transposase
MRLIGFLSLFLLVICIGHSEGTVSSHVVAPSIAGKNSSPTCHQSEYAGLPVLWSEVTAQRRKRRPYRDPLRRYRKKLRLEKRKHNRSLKKASQEVCQPSKGLESKAGSEVQLTEESNLRAKRGRKPSIETVHVFCPTQGCRGHNVLGPHPDHWIVGAGTYNVKGNGKRQMYRCNWCGQRFSETHGTVFYGLKTHQETVYRALHCLCENMSIRGTARVFNVKPDTILLWLRRAGEHSQKVSEYLMKNLHVEQVQLDELWTFVFKKEKTLSSWEKLHTEYGDTWVWTALEPTHKLVLALVVGEHEEEQAVNLLEKLKSLLVNGCLPLLVSDQLPHYVKAVLKVFGRWVEGERGRFPNPRLEPTEDLQYATVNKEYQKGTVISVTIEVVFGSVREMLSHLKALGMKKINTSFVERMNLTLRHLVSRLRRKGLTFSKKRQYLKWHLNLAVAYYHFVRPHRGLRLRLPEPIPTKGNGSPKKWDKRTPAMSAELTDHIWSIQELLTFRVPQLPAVCT